MLLLLQVAAVSYNFLCHQFISVATQAKLQVVSPNTCILITLEMQNENNSVLGMLNQHA